MPDRLRVGKEGSAELGGQGGKVGRSNGLGFEMKFEFAGYARALVETEHSEAAGELVSDAGGFGLEF